MAQHTPGPWTAACKSAFDQQLSCIRCDHATHPLITDVADRPVGGSWISAEAVAEKEANARLIAAAPELLQALKDAREALAMCSPISDHGAKCQREAILQAAAVIKKATQP